jgi:hypothetical protein
MDHSPAAVMNWRPVQPETLKECLEINRKQMGRELVGHARAFSAPLRGLTDKELSEALRLKLPMVKKRWVSACNRVAISKPDLLRGIDDNLNGKSRGQQKRRRLLEYLRAHPGELRTVSLSFRFTSQLSRYLD